MKKLAILGMASTILTSQAFALDFGIELSAVHHTFKTTESYNGVQNYKKEGGYGYIGLIGGHTFNTNIGGFRIEGKFGIYGSPNGDVDLYYNNGTNSLEYTDSDFSFKGYRGEINLLYSRHITDNLYLSPFVGFGFDKRKEEVDYVAVENGSNTIDGHYEDEYKYNYGKAGLKFGYKAFYLSGTILLPTKDEIKMDKTYAGLGKPASSMGHKTGYELEAGIRWKFLKFSAKYQYRKHDRFNDPVNGEQPRSKEEWIEGGVSFIF